MKLNNKEPRLQVKQFLYKPEQFLRVRGGCGYQISGQSHMKLSRLSAVCNGHIYPPGCIPGTHSCQSIGRLQGHSTPGRTVPIKIPMALSGNKHVIFRLEAIIAIFCNASASKLSVFEYFGHCCTFFFLISDGRNLSSFYSKRCVRYRYRR